MFSIIDWDPKIFDIRPLSPSKISNCSDVIDESFVNAKLKTLDNGLLLFNKLYLNGKGSIKILVHFNFFLNSGTEVNYKFLRNHIYGIFISRIYL